MSERRETVHEIHNAAGELVQRITLVGFSPEEERAAIVHMRPAGYRGARASTQDAAASLTGLGA